MDYIELFFSKILSNVRGHEAARLIKSPAFASYPDPTISLTCDELGPSGSAMSLDHTQDGLDLFPALSWVAVPDAAEYLLIVQDVDAPLPFPITHGLFYGIPSSVTSVENKDFETLEGTRKAPKGLELVTKGGWRFVPNIRGRVYGGPRALKGHGPHRYYFQIVALKDKIDETKLSKVPKKEEVFKECEGKVLGWGEWIGVSERKFVW